MIFKAALSHGYGITPKIVTWGYCRGAPAGWERFKMALGSGGWQGNEEGGKIYPII
jgi:hypothetical protein